MRRRRLRRSAARPALAAICLCWLAPSAAWAHGTMAIGDFYGGLLEPVFHLESLLLLLAVALWTGQLPLAGQRLVPTGFAGAALAGAAAGLVGLPVPFSMWGTRVGALLLGAVVAGRVPLPLWPGLAAAVLLGFWQGHFASFGDREVLTRPVLYALGVGVGPVIVCGFSIAFVDRFPGFWGQVALRVAGSWIAAVSVLVSALALAPPR